MWRRGWKKVSLYISILFFGFLLQRHVMTFLRIFESDDLIRMMQEINKSQHNFIVPQFCPNFSHPHDYPAFVSVPDKKIVFCPIWKNGNTLMKMTLCYLNTPEKFKNIQALNLTSHAIKNYGQCSDLASSLDIPSIHDKILENRQWKKMAIVRHPVDRLISGYLFCW